MAHKDPLPEALHLLDELHSPEPCATNFDGTCSVHGWNIRGFLCVQARILDLLLRSPQYEPIPPQQRPPVIRPLTIPCPEPPGLRELHQTVRALVYAAERLINHWDCVSQTAQEDLVGDLRRKIDAVYTRDSGHTGLRDILPVTPTKDPW